MTVVPTIHLEIGTHYMSARRLIASIGLVLCVAPTAMAQELPDWVKRTTISGLAFGDAYLMAQNADTALEGANGIWLRRFYLTLDSKLSKDFQFRVRFEGNNAGDFKTASRVTPYVKDLYLRYTTGDQQVFLGIISSPTWELAEGHWGYRDVEKTPLDLQRLGSSRDFGISAKGRFNKAGKVRYHVALGNGDDINNEIDEGKKAMGALSVHPTKGLVLELYADYDARPGDTDRANLQAFAGYSSSWGRIGGLVARQRRARNNARELELDIYSGYLVIKASEKVSLLGRFDLMNDPNPDAGRIPYLAFDPTAKSNLLMAGVDFALNERVHFIPNLQYVFYGAAGTAVAPESELMLRATYSITF